MAPTTTTDGGERHLQTVVAGGTDASVMLQGSEPQVTKTSSLRCTRMLSPVGGVRVRRACSKIFKKHVTKPQLPTRAPQEDLFGWGCSFSCCLKVYFKSVLVGYRAVVCLLGAASDISMSISCICKNMCENTHKKTPPNTAGLHTRPHPHPSHFSLLTHPYLSDARCPHHPPDAPSKP